MDTFTILYLILASPMIVAVTDLIVRRFWFWMNDGSFSWEDTIANRIEIAFEAITGLEADSGVWLLASFAFLLLFGKIALFAFVVLAVCTATRWARRFQKKILKILQYLHGHPDEVEKTGVDMTMDWEEK